jgi:hypothetical protein
LLGTARHSFKTFAGKTRPPDELARTASSRGKATESEADKMGNNSSFMFSIPATITPDRLRELAHEFIESGADDERARWVQNIFENVVETPHRYLHFGSGDHMIVIAGASKGLTNWESRDALGITVGFSRFVFLLRKRGVLRRFAGGLLVISYETFEPDRVYRIGIDAAGEPDILIADLPFGWIWDRGVP